MIMKPGEYIISDKEITANAGKSTITLDVTNTGDRPVQVGSHTHFFEINKALSFPREKAYGFHLNIPSGTSIRFEQVILEQLITEYGGNRIVFGFSGLVNGRLDEKRQDALNLAKERGFKEVST